MTKRPFKFKQFNIHQDQCAMKIGTDAVLLGAWADLSSNPFSILDIGSGTGILALMLAQRSAAEVIEAIEIDAQAYEQCVNNFELSPWRDRLFCYHASLLEFTEEIEDTYDLIICNPPFYSDTFKTANDQRDLARFEDAMPFEHLIKGVSKLLSKEGTFNVIVPSKEESRFISLATTVHLHPSNILRIKGNPNSEIIRSMIAFSFEKKSTIIDELIIETKRHQYTEDYIALTKDFYLKL